MKKVVAIIQARMGSSRLPGKILKKVMGKTLLEYQLERVQQSTIIDEIVVATTKKEHDNPIVELCKQLGINVYRGSENDVLSRYFEAAVQYKADVVVRLTSDCPLIDPIVIDQVIQLYLKRSGEVDYVSNTIERTYPRGMDTEVFSFKSLEKAHKQALLARDREHVTSYIYTNLAEYQLANLACEQYLGDHRWTIDTEEDFELIRLILEKVYPNKPTFVVQDVVALLNNNPRWIEINSYIEQKTL